jgi:hypothetical protein
MPTQDDVHVLGSGGSWEWMEAGHMTDEGTEITRKIKDHRSGKMTDDELVKYLTDEVKYKRGAINPHETNTGEWWTWSQDQARYVPGSFGEAEHARDTGFLDPEVCEKVLKVFYQRMK